jgi:uncharacterized protein YjgD (DUF1641 family)
VSELEEHEAVTRAIEEHPEAVAAFIERLDVANELLDVVALATDAADDRMVAEATETAALLAESADGIATEETARLAESVGENATDLEAALETVLDLQRTGTLDALAELGDAVALALAAADDEMVTTLSATGSALGELADTAAEPETVRGLQTLLTALGEADASDPQPVGTIGLLGSMRDPEVKRGLGYLLSVARSTGRELERQE